MTATKTAMTFASWGEQPGTYVCTSDRTGNTYRVHIGEPGASCTCPGFQHNWRRPSFKGCRHILTAREQGLAERTYEYAPLSKQAERDLFARLA